MAADPPQEDVRLPDDPVPPPPHTQPSLCRRDHPALTPSPRRFSRYRTAFSVTPGSFARRTPPSPVRHQNLVQRQLHAPVLQRMNGLPGPSLYRTQFPLRKSWCLPTRRPYGRLLPTSRPGYRTQFRSSRAGYRTQFRSADPVIAPSSDQRPGYRTQFRSADPVIAPSSDQQTRLSHPVPISRPGYRTQFRTADPVIAPSSDQQTRLSHPVPISRAVIAPSSEQPTRLSHPVLNNRPRYRTQFRPADPVIAPSSEQPSPGYRTQFTPDPGYRTQFDPTGALIAPSSDQARSARILDERELPAAESPLQS